MKASDVLRAEKRPQIQDELVAYNDEGEVSGLCAIGCLMLAISPILCTVEVKGLSCFYPEQDWSMPVSCCGLTGNLLEHIMHLNDYHHFSFTNIADYLDRFEQSLAHDRIIKQVEGIIQHRDYELVLPEKELVGAQ